MNLSIIIPAFNEEKSIVKVLDDVKKGLRGHSHSYEIIVVDDGSTDKTFEQASSQKARVIQHSHNEGYGAALKTGIKAAKYDWILIIDGDGTYPAEKIPSLLKFIPEYDMVVGARIEKEARISSLRRPARWFLTLLARFLTGKKIPDLNSGLRVIKKNLIEKFFFILPDGFSFTSTVSLALVTNGHSIKYVPIEYSERGGKSKIRPLRDTFNFIQLIVRTVLYFNPLKVFIPMSAFLFFPAVLLLLYRTFVAQSFGVTITILFISSFQILAIGMLADLIDKRGR